MTLRSLLKNIPKKRLSKVFSKVHFSSAHDNWSTPKDVYASLDNEFRFNCDPCPLDYSGTHGALWGTDGLEKDWGTSTFVNPPYSNLKDWCAKAYKEAKQGKTVVMLIPSRTDTAYWHDYVMKAKEIRFVRGRLKFGDAKNCAPFPSAIVVFAPEIDTVSDEQTVGK